VKLLLDTHILLWVLMGARELGSNARAWIDGAEEVHVSSVSLWEASIKAMTGKLKADLDRLDEQLAANGFVQLPVTWTHVRQLRHLPMLHRDPFDRMLVAQAISEPLHLLTHDAALAAYSDLVTVV
jgi:PIN domain nuclease of toxin-antitoxin system